MPTAKMTEVAAMGQVEEALKDLNEGERERIITWAISKFNVAVAVPKASGGGGDGGTGGSGGGGGGTVSGSGAVNAAGGPKKFMLAKKPKTDVERIACLAYILTHHSNMPTFTNEDLSKMNGDAGQHDFSNARAAVRNATNQNKFLAKAGRGAKRLTAHGEQVVDALPDREKVAALDGPRRKRRKKGKGQ